METNEWISLGEVTCIRRTDKVSRCLELVLKEVYALPAFAIKDGKDYESVSVDNTRTRIGGMLFNSESPRYYIQVPEEIIAIKNRMMSKSAEK